MKQFFLIIFFMTCFIQLNYSQKLRDFPAGIGVDVLTGHNELNWDLEFYNISRNESFVTLNARVFYRLNIITSFYIEPAIGFIQYGGKSPTEPSGYKDRLELSAIEAGGFFLYHTNFFGVEVGLGLKAKYLLSAKWQQLGEIDDPLNSSRTWTEEDAKELFADLSYNAGFRVAVPFGNYRFGIEYWRGLDDIKNDDHFDTIPVDNGGTIKENHYRFTFGIMF